MLSSGPRLPSCQECSGNWLTTAPPTRPLCPSWGRLQGRRCSAGPSWGWGWGAEALAVTTSSPASPSAQCCPLHCPTDAIPGTPGTNLEPRVCFQKTWCNTRRGVKFLVFLGSQANVYPTLDNVYAVCPHYSWSVVMWRIFISFEAGSLLKTLTKNTGDSIRRLGLSHWVTLTASSFFWLFKWKESP